MAAEAKANLTSLGPGITKLEGDGGDLGSPPPIKQEPEGPPSVKTNSVNGENNCDTSTPATPTGAGGTEGAPATPLQPLSPFSGKNRLRKNRAALGWGGLGWAAPA